MKGGVKVKYRPMPAACGEPDGIFQSFDGLVAVGRRKYAGGSSGETNTKGSL